MDVDAHWTPPLITMGAGLGMRGDSVGDGGSGDGARAHARTRAVDAVYLNRCAVWGTGPHVLWGAVYKSIRIAVANHSTCRRDRLARRKQKRPASAQGAPSSQERDRWLDS